MIYLLEDDDSIRELVIYSLEKTGNTAVGFPLPSLFFESLEKEIPDLVLLDQMLPETDGLSVLKKIRTDARTKDVPVIMLTAKGTEFDKVTALDAGADDYIVKPFGVMELVARVRAVLRRTGSGPKDEESYTAGCVELSLTRHEVKVSGKVVALTYKEFELLAYLFANRGRVLSRDKILSAVWGYEFFGENRTIDVHIRTLRQKLGEGGDVVQTVRGVGYRIADESL